MNRLIMSSSPQTSYTVSFSIVLSSAVADLSADGHERKMQLYSIFVQAVTHSRSLCILSDSFVLYSCSCYVLLAEFRTSANLSGFH